ncbi:hypothetical protein ES332_A12G099300v1 [Gossypium tomentosum]|uniref:Uncharacterized protein n=1 Tax=Gossypium tomentosum TaxID=34277 RepID=A0A5D2MW53_GOSTO|nr:hypothetical protein ES332_A12G099300v1 [Gossypium tomentosum]
MTLRGPKCILGGSGPMPPPSPNFAPSWTLYCSELPAGHSLGLGESKLRAPVANTF